MPAKPWKHLMPGCGQLNDPNDQFRQVPLNTCAACGRWRYLLHAIGAGAVVILILTISAVAWILGMPERNYTEKYSLYLQNDGKIDPEEEDELDKLAQKYGLDRDKVAQIQLEVQKKLNLAPPITSATPERKVAVEDDKSIPRLLRVIYEDGIKTADEQHELDDLAQRVSIDSAKLAQMEQEIKDRINKSEISLKQGMVYANQKDYSQAVKEFKLSIEADSENAYAWANLASAYLNLNNQQEAQAACDRALALDSNNWFAHYNLGSLYARRGDKEQAISELSEALRLVAEGQSKRITSNEVMDHMKTDQMLNSLRSDQRFQRLLARN